MFKLYFVGLHPSGLPWDAERYNVSASFWMCSSRPYFGRTGLGLANPIWDSSSFSYNSLLTWSCWEKSYVTLGWGIIINADYNQICMSIPGRTNYVMVLTWCLEAVNLYMKNPNTYNIKKPSSILSTPMVPLDVLTHRILIDSQLRLDRKEEIIIFF